MKKIKNIKSVFLGNKFLWFRYIPISFIIFFFAFSLLKYPQYSGAGVAKGLDLCLGTLIPSLFPFLILSNFYVSSGLCEKAGRYFTKITTLFFKQPGVSANVIFLSLIGGFPVGAKIIAQLYENKQLSTIQAQRLMLFCVNAGPAFVISCVGYYMLGSKQAGIIMYISLTLASLIIGVLSRFFLEDDEKNYSESYNVSYDKPISEALVSSVSQGTTGMVSICAWVILFSCINELINAYSISYSVSQILSSFLEVTTGCSITSSTMPIAVVTGIIGFSGFCVHFQIMSSIVKVKLKYKYFLTARIISAALSMIICQQILNFYPQQVEVFASSAESTASLFSVSIPVSMGLILMCAMLLLGDNYRVGKIGVKK